MSFWKRIGPVAIRVADEHAKAHEHAHVHTTATATAPAPAHEKQMFLDRLWILSKLDMHELRGLSDVYGIWPRLRGDPAKELPNLSPEDRDVVWQAILDRLKSEANANANANASAGACANDELADDLLAHLKAIIDFSDRSMPANLKLAIERAKQRISVAEGVE